MADSSSSPATTAQPNPSQETPSSDSSNLPDPLPSSTIPPPPPQAQPSPSPLAINPNSNPPIASTPPPPTLSYAPSQVPSGAVLPPAPPSFRPAPIQTPQFTPIPTPSYQNPGVPPPGVSSAVPMAPGIGTGGTGAVPLSVPQVQPVMAYQVPPGQPPNPALRLYAPMPNGYAAIPAAPQGTIPAAGMPRFVPQYGTMVRPTYPPRPPGAIGVLPGVARPPVAGIPPVRPVVPPIVRPVVAPSVSPAEKPQTTVYVGKIAPTVENDFMLSLLQLCGPVKSWKQVQNPSDGTPRGFGFCEFESAEGVLRSLRLLSKFRIDGQELLLNVDKATRKYLKSYVDRKAENAKKLKENEAAESGKDNEAIQPTETDNCSKAADESKKEDTDMENKESNDFGFMTDEDKAGDREALEKLTNIIEERLKTKPPPPPPLPVQATGDGSENIDSELPAKSKDVGSDGDLLKNEAADAKNDEETNGDKTSSELDRPETSSPDRNRRYDRRSRDRDRDRDLKREKEREIERYEREAERERVRKEREQRRKIEEAERQYEECLKEWEYREKEKEKQRQYEKEREKERERKRKKEIIYDEDNGDEDSRKRWRRSVLEEKKRKRLHEKEDDLADRQKEDEEIAEAKRRAEEEQQQKQERDAKMLLSDHGTNENEKTTVAEDFNGKAKVHANEQDNVVDNGEESHTGNKNLHNGNNESIVLSVGALDTQQGANAPAKKLGFGLVGSGKRAAVPSVFHDEEEEDTHRDKKRLFVPIDYSTEELQAVQPAVSGSAPANLAAAAEFAKRISNTSSKEEKPDTERDRSRRSNEKSNYRDRDKNNEDGIRSRDENKEKHPGRDRDRDHGSDKPRASDNKKLLDAKQLIDMIPKTKEELFSYEINWAIYDQHELHERMRPWISKKITEFLGEEETTLVDYIVSSTQEHVKAAQMLELLQSILDDEAEMFVLKMWRMLIFEIKKVETGLALRPR